VFNYEVVLTFQVLHWRLHGHFHYSTKSHDADDEKRWTAILNVGKTCGTDNVFIEMCFSYALFESRRASVGFEALSVVAPYMLVFWDIMLCTPVEVT
jgi:hypothetical protein